MLGSGARPHRKFLLDKSLLYAFSADINVEEGREDIGFVPGGLRINVYASPSNSRVYNVAGETTLLGERLVAGTVAWGTDWLLARKDDIEIIDVRLVIRTDEGSLIEKCTSGIFSPGPRAFRRLVTEKPKIGTELQPVAGAVHVAPRFHSGDPKYGWLSGRQCLAFGEVLFIKSVARQASFDVYVMD
jgi:hypothetical protein